MPGVRGDYVHTYIQRVWRGREGMGGSCVLDLAYTDTGIDLPISLNLTWCLLVFPGFFQKDS